MRVVIMFSILFLFAAPGLAADLSEEYLNSIAPLPEVEEMAEQACEPCQAKLPPLPMEPGWKSNEEMEFVEVDYEMGCPDYREFMACKDDVCVSGRSLCYAFCDSAFPFWENPNCTTCHIECNNYCNEEYTDCVDDCYDNCTAEYDPVYMGWCQCY